MPVKQELVCDIVFGDSSGHYSQQDRTRLGITTTDVPGADIVMPVSCESGRLLVAVESTLLVQDDDMPSDEPVTEWQWVSLLELYSAPCFHLAAEYFSACVRLYVEMCLNRNYVCITEIAPMFPRDKLYEGGCAAVLTAPACVAFE